MSEAVTKTKPDMSDIIKLIIVVYPPGSTHPDLDDERSDRSDHDVVRAHFTSLEEAEACAAVHDLQRPKKPRTAALRAETKAAWDECEAQRAESGKPLTNERRRPWTVSKPTTLLGNCTQ
jgi:hypothetical protein